MMEGQWRQLSTGPDRNAAAGYAVSARPTSTFTPTTMITITAMARTNRPTCLVQAGGGDVGAVAGEGILVVVDDMTSH